MWRMKFGTPTFVIDEADFRHRIRRYRAALPDARLVYAGRELLTSTVARWVVEEGGGLGVCSRGELATALVAGVDPNQIVVPRIRVHLSTRRLGMVEHLYGTGAGRRGRRDPGGRYVGSGHGNHRGLLGHRRDVPMDAVLPDGLNRADSP